MQARLEWFQLKLQRHPRGWAIRAILPDAQHCCGTNPNNQFKEQPDASVAYQEMVELVRQCMLQISSSGK